MKPPARWKVVAAAGSTAAALALGSCGTARAGAQPQARVSASAAARPAGTRTAARPAYPVRRLAAVLQQLVVGQDGTHITSRQAVRTTWGRALGVATPGDSDDEDPTIGVYVIRAEGRFSGAGHSRPAGAPLVPARVVLAVVDARTFAVTDLSEGTRRGDLGSLGVVFTLPAVG